MRTRTLAHVALAAALSSGAAAAAASLQEVKETGRLRVAVYEDYAPFADDGQGIDVDVAKALAERLGVAAELMPVKAGERMEDDLRNAVWKGHYLRKERLADVMLHVPVDPEWAKKNEQVRIFAPYFRERLVVARNRNIIPQLVTLEVFGAEKIGVEYDTLEDNYLFNAFGGRLRESVVHYPSTVAAAAALRKNEVAAVMGRQTHIEAALAGSASGFAIGPVATPGLPTSGWDVGVAVKADAAELAAAIDRAMADLRKDGVIERIFTKRGLTYATPHDASATAKVP